jgi:hypothetical protein
MICLPDQPGDDGPLLKKRKNGEDHSQAESRLFSQFGESGELKLHDQVRKLRIYFFSMARLALGIITAADCDPAKSSGPRRQRTPFWARCCQLASALEASATAGATLRAWSSGQLGQRHANHWSSNVIVIDDASKSGQNEIMERLFRLGLIVVALSALAAGLATWGFGRAEAASWIWALGTIPVVAGLAVSMTRDLLAGRIGVDAIALVSMTAALLLGETLAGIVVAVMYAGGNVLEDFAVARAERNLKSLVDRAPRTAHRRVDHGFEDIPVEQVVVGDAILVRAGEVIPIDGVLTSPSAVIDEAALTGEPIPVTRLSVHCALSNGPPADGSTMIRWVSRVTRAVGSGTTSWLFAASLGGANAPGAVRSKVAGVDFGAPPPAMCSNAERIPSTRSELRASAPVNVLRLAMALCSASELSASSASSLRSV